MPVEYRGRSETMAYAAAGMEPPPVVPLRKSDPRQAGPYRLLSVLGSGGMGRVYLGRDATGSTGPAAVKVIRPEYAEDPRFRKRFEREVGALDSIQGAHIVRLLGSGCDEELVWVATEYIPGPTLDQLVDARGPVDAAAAWRLMGDVGRAIEAIWRAGLVHRDLKPSNVILGADGARVIDFGVVQATDGTSITATGQNVGTPAYMSPEQVRGQEVTAASDIFSLASTLTYAVAGEAPFGEGTGVDVLHRVAFDPPREETLDKVAAVDAELAAFIRVCLDKDPEQRPLPEAVFRTAIGHQLSGPVGDPPRVARKREASPSLAISPAVRPVATPPEPPTEPQVPPGKRGFAPGRRGRLIVGAVAAAVLVAGGSTAALLLHHDGGGTSAGAGPEASSAAAGAENSPAAPSSSPAADSTLPGTGNVASQSPTKAPATHDPAALDIRIASCVAEIASHSHGDCVKALQLLLAGYGLHVTVDGDYGVATSDAVKAFQTEAGTTPSGSVDAQTMKLLYGTERGAVRTGSVTVTESVRAVGVARCLDARVAAVQVWGCNGTAAQKWALYRVPGHASQYLVVNQGSHNCLDADAGTVGQNFSKIRARSCDGLSAQRWQLGSAGTLVSVPDGFCLDAKASESGQDGQPVQTFGCAGGSNQVWNWHS
ncbi:Serine/threonine protein kinase [Streptomyces sp. 3213]|uniref:protein kinase domain-containing protein n=1 Tax=Streptomyces sp. 3213.3 TaxID=1855348 RepID=UPI0008978F98|nr:protein kinase [Streptomyces sp. 3213.3]SEC89927.1 Serine/threonine protein kinase [Streptomyces sp. 3213] [Streptomyces sp. 3213.3]